MKLNQKREGKYTLKKTKPVDLAQVIEYLPIKCEALCSTTILPKNLNENLKFKKINKYTKRHQRT
jgi:hypothetical protein